MKNQEWSARFSVLVDLKTKPTLHLTLPSGGSQGPQRKDGDTPPTGSARDWFWIPLDPLLRQDTARQLAIHGGWCPFSPKWCIKGCLLVSVIICLYFFFNRF